MPTKPFPKRFLFSISLKIDLFMKSILQVIKRTLMRELVRGPRCAVVLALIVATPVQADINIPSDGSDGALNITQNTEIDLSLAVTGQWNDSNAANAGKGVYDPNQWAVVFKYSSVNVGPGATVTFKNHPSHAPVVWLVGGDIVISGTVSVDGRGYNTSNPLSPNEPGPGGFRGGAISPLSTGKGGYGPDGGRPIDNFGGENSYGGNYGVSYGNPDLAPLIGGSGASGIPGGYLGRGAGASGAGALLIATSKSVLIEGQIRALGGYTIDSRGALGAQVSKGGDGAIRIVGDTIQGGGQINAGSGRIRTEANSLSARLTLTPNTIGVPPGLNPQIWPIESAPRAFIRSVHTAPVPNNPLAGVETATDLNIQTNGALKVTIETRNFPPNGAVTLRVIPKYGAFYDVAAGFANGGFSNATWSATTTLPQGFCVLQAHATSP